MVDEDYFCEFMWGPVCVTWANFLCQNDSLTDSNQCCDCLDVSDGPGCGANAACQLQICLWDHFCCDTQWDFICVREAHNYCADTGTLVVYVSIIWLCLWFIFAETVVHFLENAVTDYF